jgi:hypothetical protein
MQRRISVIGEEFGEKPERIMSELGKMTLTVKQSSKTTRQINEQLSKR